jgi:PhnB protein
MAVKAKPDGYHTVTPHLIVRGGAKAIEFYRNAFGAEESVRTAGPDGRIMHAEMRLGDSVIMLSDEFPEQGIKSPQSLGGSSAGIFLYVESVDAAFKRAVDAGCAVKMPPTDMFWGDRFARLTDPFGHAWALATHVEDVPKDEILRRLQQHQNQ